MKNGALIAIAGIATLGIGYLAVRHYQNKHAEAAAPITPPAAKPSLTILEPAEESSVLANSTIKLKWLSKDVGGVLHIFYHLNNEDDPFWVQVPDSPNVLDGTCDFIVPDRPGSKMALSIGVWDWDKGEWIALTSTQTSIYLVAS